MVCVFMTGKACSAAGARDWPSALGCQAGVGILSADCSCQNPPAAAVKGKPELLLLQQHQYMTVQCPLLSRCNTVLMHADGMHECLCCH